MIKKYFCYYLLFCLIFASSAFAQTWKQVGSGLNGSILCFEVYNNELYTGGWFISNGNGDSLHYIAKWNGTDWLPVGKGLNGPVKTMAVYNNKLYVAGIFTYAGNIPVSYIARWDGLKWDSVGSGVSWSWGSGQYPIWTLELYNGELYAGGEFTRAGDIWGVGSIAKWNDTVWKDLNGGVSVLFQNAQVEAIHPYKDKLIVSGYFTNAGGQSCTEVAEWDGSAWACIPSYPSTRPYTFAMHDSLLYGGTTNVIFWDGINWDSLPQSPNGAVSALTSFNNELLAGGLFVTAGTDTVNNIAKWNNTSWKGIGKGFNGEVIALTTFNGELFAGGSFTQAGSNIINHVARLDTTTDLNEYGVYTKIQVNIYPIPFTSTATLYITMPDNLQSKLLNFQLFNLMGQEISGFAIRSPSTTIQVEGWPDGVYFYKIFNGKRPIASGKLVISE